VDALVISLRVSSPTFFGTAVVDERLALRGWGHRGSAGGVVQGAVYAVDSPSSSGDHASGRRDFNDWSRTAIPMGKRDGPFVATVVLDSGHDVPLPLARHGARWKRDPAEDRLVNGLGSENSVIGT